MKGGPLSHQDPAPCDKCGATDSPKIVAALAAAAALALLVLFAAKCRADMRAAGNQAEIAKNLKSIAFAIEDLHR